MFEGNTRNNQDIFNYIVEQFVINKVPQCSYEGTCRYPPVTEEHIGCAVGCLLPPEAAERWKEFDYINVVQVDTPESYGEFFDDSQISFLYDLQMWHDYTLNFHREKGTLLYCGIISLFNLANKHDLFEPPTVD